MKKYALLVVSLCAFISLEAQEEIYFSEDSTQTTTTLQGVSLSGKGNKYFTSLIELRTRYEMNYLYEKSFSKPITAVFNGFFSYHQVKKYYPEYYSGVSNDNEPTYNSDYLLFGLRVEPRYYFSLNSRTSDKRGGLNSGWFVGLPLEVAVILNKPQYYDHKDGNTWVSNNDLTFKDRLKYSVGFNVGYRYAITNRLFAEATLGLNYLNMEDYFFSYHWSLYGKIALAYTF